MPGKIEAASGAAVAYAGLGKPLMARQTEPHRLEEAGVVAELTDYFVRGTLRHAHTQRSAEVTTGSA